MALKSEEHKVITPLLPPVPGETKTGPVQMFSIKVMFARCVSCRSTIIGTFLALFLIAPIVCNSLRSEVRPLQFTDIISNREGPGLDSIPPLNKLILISLHVMIRTTVITPFASKYLKFFKVFTVFDERL